MNAIKQSVACCRFPGMLSLLLVVAVQPAPGRAADKSKTASTEILVPLPTPLPPSTGLSGGAPLKLTGRTGGQPVVGQVAGKGPWKPNTAFVLLPVPPEGLAGHLTFVAEPDPTAESPFTFTDENQTSLKLSEGSKHVLTYNYGMMLAPGVPPDRRRSAYIHPVVGLDGEIISDDFPRDHYHHRGIFWAWPHVYFEGKTYDLWTIQGIHARFEKWLTRETGPAYALIGVQNGWYIGDRKVLTETVWLQVFPAGQTGRAIDIHLTFQPEDKPVLIEGTHARSKGYGGYNFRFAPRTETVMTTDKGRLPEDDNRTPFAWADYSARFDGATARSGAAVFPHPKNPDLPGGWCLRHYGFVGTAWPGLEKLTITRDKPLVLQYRTWGHRHDAGPARVADAYTIYARRPKITLTVRQQPNAR